MHANYLPMELQLMHTFGIQFSQVYLLKIKGKAKIPDYVQLRDDNYTLVAYFRVDRPEKALDKIGLGDRETEIINLIQTMPFGKFQKLEI